MAPPEVDREQSRAPAAAQPLVHFVPMHERARAGPRRVRILGRHGHDGVEVVRVRDARYGHAPAHQREEIVLRVLAARRLRDDLLREDVERRVLRHDAIELAAADRAKQRRALDQIVARDREEPSFRQARHRVPGAADALEKRGNAVRRSNLADEIDVPDVDAELERGGRHERFQRAALSRISASSRFSFDRLPWWAVTARRRAAR